MEIKKPNWDYWGRLCTVPLCDGICLSFDIDPNRKFWFPDIVAPADESLFKVGPDIQSLRKQLRERLDIALTWVEQKPDGIAIAKEGAQFYRNFGAQHSSVVELRSLIDWAIKLEIPLPSQMIAIKRATERGSSVVPVSGESRRTVMLELPYENDFMRNLADIMWKHYAALKEGEKPYQTKIQLEIDKMMGLKNRKPNEAGSSTAVAIAKRLQPCTNRTDNCTTNV